MAPSERKSGKPRDAPAPPIDEELTELSLSGTHSWRSTPPLLISAALSRSDNPLSDTDSDKKVSGNSADEARLGRISAGLRGLRLLCDELDVEL